MRNSPVLASRTIAKGSKLARGSRVALSFQVEGGLHYLQGNQKPYFSLTYTEHRKGFPNQCYSGGAGHERIAELFGDRFAELTKMHLSDIDGRPMHGYANGWYDLAGCLPGNAGERYHAGNSNRHFPKPVIDPDRPWDATDYRKPTPEECLQVFADHVRVGLDEAGEVREMVITAAGGSDWKAGRDAFSHWIEAQVPRWKAEADAVIAKYGLVVYGDAWDVAA